MFKFAKQNLVKSPLRSFLMLFGFTFMMVIISLATTMQDVMRQYYIYQYERRTEHIDLEMTIGTNSEARYFSTRDLNELALNNHATVFKIDTMTEENTYLTLMATNEADFELLYGQYYSLLENEIILTETTANRLGLKQSETLTLTIGSGHLTFIVKDIIPDYGVFQGEKGFIRHDPHVATLLKTLLPSLSNYPDSFFINFNNTVYFDTNDIASTIQVMSSIPSYQQLDFKVSIPTNYINQLINRAVSLFQLMLLFIGVTVFLLIQTTYALVFKEKEQMLSTIQLLGGSLRFGFGLWVIEMGLLTIPAFFLAYGLTYGIIQMGMWVLLPGLSYPLSWLSVLISLSLVWGLFAITILYYSVRWHTKTEITRLKFVPSKRVSWLVHIIIVSFGLGIYALLNRGSLNDTLIRLVIIVLIAYSVILLIHPLGGYGLKLFKQQPYTFLFKMSDNKKSLYRFLILSLTTIVSITLLIQTTGYIQLKANHIRREYQADLVLSNVLRQMDVVQTEVSAIPEVSNSTPVGIYRNVKIMPTDQTFQAIYAIDPAKITEYFGMVAVQNSLDDFIHSHEPAIWLPMRYQAVYGLKVGDTITLDINPSFEQVSLKVIGFFDEAVGNTAFINLHQYVGYEGLKQTHLLIKTDDVKTVQTKLMNEYGSRLYYVYDFQAGAKALSDEVIQSMHYATVISFVILAGLFLSLLNQGILLFDELKTNYMRVSILGFSFKQIATYIGFEGIVIASTLTLSSSILLMLLNPLIKPLLLLFNEYEKIVFAPNDFLIGLCLGNLLILFTRFFYIRKLSQMNIVSVLKMHDLN